jgi:hypothetical protein
MPPMKHKLVIDSSGMTIFWRIVDKLSMGIEPGKSEWNSLFTSKGYKSIIHEFTPEFLKDNYREAYKPSKENERSAPNKFVKHYQQAKEKRVEIDQWIKVFKKNTRQISDAEERAKEWLPREPGKTIIITFAVFDHDARGYDTIVLDPLFAKSLGEDVYDMLAHEIFHFYSRELLVHDTRCLTGVGLEIFWAIKQLQEEGIADHIYAIPYPGRQEDIENSPRIIRELNTVLENLSFASSLEDISKTVKDILPRSGHPTGYYMVEAILQGLGKEKLTSSVGNPFLFINLYDEAASVLNLQGFSNDSIRYLDGLSNRANPINDYNQIKPV